MNYSIKERSSFMNAQGELAHPGYLNFIPVEIIEIIISYLSYHSFDKFSKAHTIISNLNYNLIHYYHFNEILEHTISFDDYVRLLKLEYKQKLLTSITNEIQLFYEGIPQVDVMK